MSAISQANIRLCGSHCGVEIGPDGPSQMALEDLAMMRAVYGSTILYPSDATSAAARAGGLGSAVLDAFNDAGHPVRIRHLAVRGLPGSGTPAQLMEAAGISAGQIAQAARELLGA